MKVIPVTAAQHIAIDYGYDQVVIIGRRVDRPDEPGGEHMTTYGATVEHCRVAGLMGKALQSNLMKWPDDWKPTVENLQALPLGLRRYIRSLQPDIPF